MVTTACLTCLYIELIGILLLYDQRAQLITTSHRSECTNLLVGFTSNKTKRNGSTVNSIGNKGPKPIFPMLQEHITQKLNHRCSLSSKMYLPDLHLSLKLYLHTYIHIYIQDELTQHGRDNTDSAK